MNLNVFLVDEINIFSVLLLGLQTGQFKVQYRLKNCLLVPHPEILLKLVEFLAL